MSLRQRAVGSAFWRTTANSKGIDRFVPIVQICRRVCSFSYNGSTKVIVMALLQSGTVSTRLFFLQVRIWTKLKRIKIR